MAESFDAIEKKLAEHAKTARAVRERMDALKSAQEQPEGSPAPRVQMDIRNPPLPLPQNKR